MDKQEAARQTVPPAATAVHPGKQEAAARGNLQELPPYVILGEPTWHWALPIIDFFNTLPIVTNLRPKLSSMLYEEERYKRTFSSSSDEEEHLKETFACNLPTATAGLVAGTLYLTNKNVAFCSDNPLSFAASHGHYMIKVPLGKIATVEPITMMDNPFPPAEYVHIVTVDSHDFWFMGFLSFDDAVHSLSSRPFPCRAPGTASSASTAPSPAASDRHTWRLAVPVVYVTLLCSCPLLRWCPSRRMLESDLAGAFY